MRRLLAWLSAKLVEYHEAQEKADFDPQAILSEVTDAIADEDGFYLKTLAAAYYTKTRTPPDETALCRTYDRKTGKTYYHFCPLEETLA